MGRVPEGRAVAVGAGPCERRASRPGFWSHALDSSHWPAGVAWRGSEGPVVGGGKAGTSLIGHR
ncbi:hypothetical protein E2C01_085682 [Portunus trituberculatus]|uniref:Uncharacterized protein n=1 Tax=Portunus trituberculatus TaxID=210409 RepID=A0A5B7J7I3_PORTR|nr:hypothetical protein [Portunus trituberculatus]